MVLLDVVVELLYNNGNKELHLQELYSSDHSGGDIF